MSFPICFITSLHVGRILFSKKGLFLSSIKISSIYFRFLVSGPLFPFCCICSTCELLKKIYLQEMWVWYESERILLVLLRFMLLMEKVTLLKKFCLQGMRDGQYKKWLYLKYLLQILPVRNARMKRIGKDIFSNINTHAWNCLFFAEIHVGNTNCDCS